MKPNTLGFNNEVTCRLVVVEPTGIFDDCYLMRLRTGNEETAEHFNRYFRRLLRLKLWGKFSRERMDEMIDSVMTIALDRIMKGEPRDPARLAAYIAGICGNLTRRALRPSFNEGGSDPDDLHLADQAENAEQRLLKQEEARSLHKVLDSLAPRDRSILVDVFYHETDRDEVCRKYKVNRQTLRSIVFRARQRFQTYWQH